jgi:hypothetical protein
MGIRSSVTAQFAGLTLDQAVVGSFNRFAVYAATVVGFAVTVIAFFTALSDTVAALFTGNPHLLTVEPLLLLAVGIATIAIYLVTVIAPLAQGLLAVATCGWARAHLLAAPVEAVNSVIDQQAVVVFDNGSRVITSRLGSGVDRPFGP